MKWLFIPVFSEDGQTITFKKFKYVRKEDCKIIAVMTIQEMRKFYGQD